MMIIIIIIKIISITSVIITICPVMLNNYLFISEDRRKYRREDKTRTKT
jgi:hypothetical protein